MTREEAITDRRKLLAEISDIESEITAIEHRRGWDAVAVERARISAVRASVTMQLVGLFAHNQRPTDPYDKPFSAGPCAAVQ